jgi:RNA polymerase sigma-70 factor, ECF subfamily
MIVADTCGTQGSGSRTAALHPCASDAVLPHLDVAYRLARWLAGSERDAEAIVLESVRIAVVRAGALAGGADRAWFLRIVSEACTDWGRRACDDAVGAPFDATGDTRIGSRFDWAARRRDESSEVEDAIARLPGHLREVVVLRELEGLSTEELAIVMGVPAATVASWLSRARIALAGVLFARLAAV